MAVAAEAAEVVATMQPQQARADDAEEGGREGGREREGATVVLLFPHKKLR